MKTMFLLKIAQDPRLHFRRKKTFEKNWRHGFFRKQFLKKRNF